MICTEEGTVHGAHSGWRNCVLVCFTALSGYGYGFKYLEDSLQLINTTQDPSSSFPPYLIVKKKKKFNLNN